MRNDMIEDLKETVADQRTTIRDLEDALEDAEAEIDRQTDLIARLQDGSRRQRENIADLRRQLRRA